MSQANELLHGIDVSHFQGKINWLKVKKAKIDFAYIKASDGDDWHDPFFLSNVTHCHDLAIPYGAYHFFRPSLPVTKQVDFFIKQLTKVNCQLPPVLDVEINNGLTQSQLVERLSRFLTHLEDAYQRTPMIYTNLNFWKRNVEHHFNQYPLWLAAWQQSEPQQLPMGWTSWSLWQYSNQGKIKGIDTYVDLNYMKKSLLMSSD